MVPHASQLHVLSQPCDRITLATDRNHLIFLGGFISLFSFSGVFSLLVIRTQSFSLIPARHNDSYAANTFVSSALWGLATLTCAQSLPRAWQCRASMGLWWWQVACFRRVCGTTCAADQILVWSASSCSTDNGRRTGCLCLGAAFVESHINCRPLKSNNILTERLHNLVVALLKSQISIFTIIGVFRKFTKHYGYLV